MYSLLLSNFRYNHYSIFVLSVESAVVIGKRKHFEMTNMYKFFCHRKHTVATAYNFST